MAFIAAGIWYFFLAGPTEVELASGHTFFVNVICKTDIVAQMKGFDKGIDAIRNRTARDLATGAHGVDLKVYERLKIIFAIANSQMEKSEVKLQTIKRLAAMKDPLRKMFYDDIIKDSMAACRPRAPSPEAVTKIVDNLLILIPRAAYIY
jgi:hypothetical protein